MPKEMELRIWDETDEYFRHRVKDPALFQEDSFRTITLKADKPRVKAVIGKLKGETTTTIQSVLFPKEDGWTLAKAKEWVADHKDDLRGRDLYRLVARTMIGKKQERIFTFEKNTINEEERTIDLSFSSEEPGERFFGFEILDHSPGSIRLKRLNDGGAVLFIHKQENHIGVIESGTAHIDTGSRKGRGIVRFGKGVLASEKFQDVKDGILRNVSVGYWVHKIVKEKEEEGIITYRVTDWEPLEISFVPVPIDPTVGVGRSAEEEVAPIVSDPEPEVIKIKEVKVEKCVKCGTLLVEDKCPTCAALEARQKETVEILAIGEKFDKSAEARQAITDGKSLMEFKDAVLAGIGRTPVIQITKDAADKKKKEGFPNFGLFLQRVAAASQQGAVPDSRLVDIRSISGMSETVPSDGGFLLQDSFTTELLALTHETGILYPKCRRIPIGPGSNSISAPVVDETSRATGSRFGGLQMYWDGEATEATAKKVKWAKIEMKLNKLHGLSYVTDEMLQDVTQLEAIVKTAFAEECNFMLDDGVINGTGAGEMLGILAAGCLVSQAKETGQTADTIISENVIKMYSRMADRSIGNSVWLANTEIFPQLCQMYTAVGTGGVAVFTPPGGLSTAPYGSLFGRPIQWVEQCAILGDLGDIIFADLAQYLIIEKGAMEAAGSIHVRFIYDEMTYKFTVRINGQPIPRSAITPYKATSGITKSPFVALAARA